MSASPLSGPMQRIFKQVNTLLDTIQMAPLNDVEELPQMAVMFTQAVWAHCSQRYLAVEYRFCVPSDPSTIFSYEFPTIPDLQSESVSAAQQVIQLIGSTVSQEDDSLLENMQKLLRGRLNTTATDTVTTEPIQGVEKASDILRLNESQARCGKLSPQPHDVTSSRESIETQTEGTNADIKLVALSSGHDFDSEHEDDIGLPGLEGSHLENGEGQDIGHAKKSFMKAGLSSENTRDRKLNMRPVIVLHRLDESRDIHGSDRSLKTSGKQELAAENDENENDVIITGIRSSKRRRTLTKKMQESSISLLSRKPEITKSNTEKGKSNNAHLPNPVVMPSSISKPKSTEIGKATILEETFTLEVPIKLENDDQDVEFDPDYSHDLMVDKNAEILVLNSPNQIPELSNQEPKSSNLVPKSPNEVPMSSNQVPRSSNQVPKSPNQVGKLPTQVPISPNQVPKSPSQVPKSPNQVPESPNLVAENPVENSSSDEDDRLKFYSENAGPHFFCIYCNNVKKMKGNLSKAKLGESYCTRPKLRNHIEGSHVKIELSTQSLKCPLCDHEPKTMNKDCKGIVNRVLKHVGEKHSVVYTFGQSAEDKNSIKDTKSSRSVEEAESSSKSHLYICPYCKLAATDMAPFRTRLELRRHIQCLHFKVGKEKQTLHCPYCPKTFYSNKMDLKNVVNRALTHFVQDHNEPITDSSAQMVNLHSTELESFVNANSSYSVTGNEQSRKRELSEDDTAGKSKKLCRDKEDKTGSVYYCFDCQMASDMSEETCHKEPFVCRKDLEDHVENLHMITGSVSKYLKCSVCTGEQHFKEFQKQKLKAVNRYLRHLEGVHTMKLNNLSSMQPYMGMRESREEKDGTADSFELDVENLLNEESMDVTGIGNCERRRLSDHIEPFDGDHFYCVECVMDWDGDISDDIRHTEPFKTRDELSVHIMVHHMTKSLEVCSVLCPVCKKTLGTDDDHGKTVRCLLRHIKEIHYISYGSEASIQKLQQKWTTRDDIYGIEDALKCESAVIPEDTLMNESDVDDGITDWQCLLCTEQGGRHASRSELEEHISKVHISQMLFECGQCSWQVWLDDSRNMDSKLASKHFVEHCILSHNLLCGKQSHAGPDDLVRLPQSNEDASKSPSEEDPLVMYEGKIPGLLKTEQTVICDVVTRRDEDSSEEPSTYNCFLCSNSAGSSRHIFNTKESYLEHLRLAHVKEENGEESGLACSLCDFMVIRGKFIMDAPGPPPVVQEILLSHMVKKHGIPVPPSALVHRCQYCSIETLISKKLEIHTRAVHKKNFDSIMKSDYRKRKDYNNDPVQCVNCGKMLKRGSIITHDESCPALVRANVRKKKYQCRFCRRAYYLKHALNSHVRAYHMKEKNTLCAECGHACFDQRALIVHAWNRHKMNLTKNPGIACTQCGMLVPQRFMYGHMRRHKKKVHECETCKAFITGTRAFQKHLQTHEENRIWKCELCEYTCKKMTGYAALHMARAHNVNRFECNLCRFVTTTEGRLEQHKRKMHPEGDIMVNFCTICSKQMSNKSAYQNHMYVRHRVNISQRAVSTCTLCGFQTLGNTLLKAHMRNHQKLNFPCKTCGKRFQTQAICNDHWSRSHGAKKHKCENCQFATRTRAHLERHMCRKHYQQSFTCVYCLFQTYTETRFKNHLRNQHNIGKDKEELMLSTLMNEKPDQLILGKALELEIPEMVEVEDERETSEEQKDLSQLSNLATAADLVSTATANVSGTLTDLVAVSETSNLDQREIVVRVLNVGEEDNLGDLAVLDSLASTEPTSSESSEVINLHSERIIATNVSSLSEPSARDVVTPRSLSDSGSIAAFTPCMSAETPIAVTDPTTLSLTDETEASETPFFPLAQQDDLAADYVGSAGVEQGGPDIQYIAASEMQQEGTVVQYMSLAGTQQEGSSMQYIPVSEAQNGSSAVQYIPVSDAQDGTAMVQCIPISDAQQASPAVRYMTVPGMQQEGDVIQFLSIADAKQDDSSVQYMPVPDPRQEGAAVQYLSVSDTPQDGTPVQYLSVSDIQQEDGTVQYMSVADSQQETVILEEVADSQLQAGEEVQYIYITTQDP